MYHSYTLFIGKKFNLSFEYKWGPDTNFKKNIMYIEENQAYFIGFGFIFAMITDFSFLYSTVIFVWIFPIFMLSSISSVPPRFEIIDDKLIKHRNSNRDAFQEI